MQTLDTSGHHITRDMDIRGAGNLLGDEQSGHVREVGVELVRWSLRQRERPRDTAAEAT